MCYLFPESHNRTKRLQLVSDSGILTRQQSDKSNSSKRHRRPNWVGSEVNRFSPAYSIYTVCGRVVCVGVCAWRTLRLERWGSECGRCDSWLPLEGRIVRTHAQCCTVTHCTQSSSSDMRLPISRGKAFRQLLVKFRVSNARNPPTPSRGDTCTQRGYRHYRHTEGIEAL